MTLNDKEIAALKALLEEYLWEVSPEEEELTSTQLKLIYAITGLRP